MNKTPFEAGKTAKELGIDTSRKFVVVERSSFMEGTTVELSKDDDSCSPLFEDIHGNKRFMAWNRLAYADEPEPYKPMVGDRVRMEGRINGVSITPGSWFSVEFDGCGNPIEPVVFEDDEIKHVKLLSRKTRTLTKAEAEAMLTEKLGESVKIE